MQTKHLITLFYETCRIHIYSGVIKTNDNNAVAVQCRNNKAKTKVYSIAETH